ncbi:hypothetical protein E4U41_004568 [Claviceps citrina]|nr:hypothetical protein E4U41_004568 [Claviceps citrina]
MESSVYYDMYPNSRLTCQPGHGHIAHDFGTEGGFMDVTGTAFVSLPSDHSPASSAFSLSDTVVAKCESAANFSADAIQKHRYLTPDYSTAQSPSVASEGFSSHFSDSYQFHCSVMSSGGDYGHNTPPGHFSMSFPSRVEINHASNYFVGLENHFDMPHASGVHSLAQQSCEHMDRQHVCNTDRRAPHHDVPGTATEEPMMGVPYADRGYQLHSAYGTHPMTKEESCSEQGLFQQLLDEKTLIPTNGALPLYDNGEGSSHMSPSIAANTQTLPRHGQPQAAASSSPSSSLCGASNCKSCKKASVLKLDRNVHEPTCQGLHCLFEFAGCDCRCKGKNEWKRHLRTQHLLSRLYTCPECPQKNFNRKDLFTQHYIRMHTSEAEKQAVKAKRTLADFDEMLRYKQAQADVGETTCPPEVPMCFFKGCDAGFPSDSTAWERCLDHVSKHLEAMATGKEARRDYNFTHDQLAYFEALGAITKDDHDCWVLGPQSNGERARENKKKAGKRPGDGEAVTWPTMNKRQRGRC